MDFPTPSRADNAPPRPIVSSAPDVADWLAYTYEGMAERRDELMRAIADQIAAAGPMTDERAGDITENLRMASELTTSAKAAHRTEKAGFLAAGRAVDGWLAKLSEPLDAVVTRAKNALRDHAVAKDAADRARRKAEADAARVRAEEMALRAAEALEDQGGAGLHVLEAAAHAASEAERAEAALDGRPTEAARTRGIYGAVSTLRTTWTFEVSDPAAVPREYLTVDRAKVLEAMKLREHGTGRPRAVIPGIAWVPERKVVVR